MLRGDKAFRPLGILCLMGLVGCSGSPWESERPNARPPSVDTARPVVAPSEESNALSTYYGRLQNDLLTQGLLRADGGGPDTPFTDSILARNFVRIALFDEYVTDGDFLRPQATLSNLRRWEKPIRMSVEFGQTVTADQQSKDLEEVSQFADRLSRLTGLDISVSDQDPNFHVMFLSIDDANAFEERIKALLPGISRAGLNALLRPGRDQRCVVVGAFDGDTSRYDKAIAVIRAEHPSMLRTACLHEELTQGLGLANDSPQARPSIFNDDEEFGRLTTHDELLLKMLYDPRLETGMSPAEAAPIARLIARDLTAATPS